MFIINSNIMQESKFFGDQGTPEQIKEAEERLTEEQKIKSKEREEAFNLGYKRAMQEAALRKGDKSILGIIKYNFPEDIYELFKSGKASYFNYMESDRLDSRNLTSDELIKAIGALWTLKQYIKEVDVNSNCDHDGGSIENDDFEANKKVIDFIADNKDKNYTGQGPHLTGFSKESKEQALIRKYARSRNVYIGDNRFNTCNTSQSLWTGGKTKEEDYDDKIIAQSK